MLAYSQALRQNSTGAWLLDILSWRPRKQMHPLTHRSLSCWNRQPVLSGEANISKQSQFIDSCSIPETPPTYVLSQISDVNIERGTYTEAVTASNEAITLLRQAHKEHTGLFARAERILAEALYAGGYDQEARNTATEALALARQTLDTRSPEFTLVQNRFEFRLSKRKAFL
jgi:hypothetical protein